MDVPEPESPATGTCRIRPDVGPSGHGHAFLEYAWPATRAPSAMVKPAICQPVRVCPRMTSPATVATKGLVQRVRDSGDRRTVRIRLSERGLLESLGDTAPQ